MNSENMDMSMAEKAKLIKQDMEKQQKENKKKAIGFIVGLLIIIFSVVGVVLSVMHIMDYFTEKSEIKTQDEFTPYDQFFIPVAAVDPVPFDDVSAAKPEELIEIAVWSIISSDLKPQNFVYTDKELLIPAEKIEEAFIKYFGNNVAITHTSVTGYGYEFSYHTEENTYYIPLTAIEPMYTPKVIEKEVKGDTETLTVGLINTSSWKQDSSTGDISRPDPDKYIKVTLIRSGNSMYITAIRSTSLPETAIVDIFTKPAEETSAEEAQESTEVTTE